MLLLKNEMYSVFFHTFIPVRTSYLSAVTSVNALDNVAVRIEETVTPIIIHNTENNRAVMDFGVLSPYLKRASNSVMKSVLLDLSLSLSV